MTPKEIAKLIQLYEKGSPNSSKIMVVGYNILPRPNSGAVSQRGIIIGNVRPDTQIQLNDYESQLRDAVLSVGYGPPQLFDAVLIDVSGSMGGMYTDEVLGNLERILGMLKLDSIWLFSDRLMKNNSASINDLCNKIPRILDRGTNIKGAFEELKQKTPVLRTLLLITDSEFSVQPDFTGVEVTRRTPSELDQC